LKGITAHYVMSRAGVAQAQARERELLTELAHAIERVAPQTLDPLQRPAWDAAGTDAARRRVVVDQVASLTDTSAIAWHHRLCVLFKVRVIQIYIGVLADPTCTDARTGSKGPCSLVGSE
ncbi:MAG: hypothetical protein ACREOE_20315, partial [Gemmatimonadales bacterium]